MSPVFDFAAVQPWGDDDGYGLGWASAAAFNTKETSKRTISFMGDGGFWHNGLTSGVGNAVFKSKRQRFDRCGQ